MRFLKHISFLLPVLVMSMVLSCTREPLEQPESDYKIIHYSAVVTGEMDTKATLNGNDLYVFEAGDSLYVSHVENSEEVLYGVLTMTSGAGQTKAHFEGDLYCDEDFEPYLSSSLPINLTLVGANDVIHTTRRGKLVSTSYEDIGVAASLEEAVQKFSDFTCSSTFGATSFNLSQSSTFLIFNIKLSPGEAPDDTPVTVTISNGSTPVWSATAEAETFNSITRTHFVAGIAGGETTLSSAKLQLSWTNAGTGTDYSKDFDLAGGLLAANRYYTISKSTLSFNGFRIRAIEDGTEVYFNYTDGIQYSKDYGETWETPPTQANGGIHLDADEEACFKGTRTDCNLSGNNQLFTTNGKLCYIAGDITSLLNYPETLPANAFRSAFSKKGTSDANADKEKPNDAASIAISSESDAVNWVDIDPNDPLILPATTAANCYMDMFLGCTSLTWAPALPATTLADKCYFRMFYNCTGLTAIPSFPSVVTMSGTSTRRRYCFQMFQSCTGITRLTEPLPVGQSSTLARGCFEDMFAHCTALDSVVVNLLPATTLATDCYRGMFQDTRFKRAPDLLATTLVPECYRFMFNSCSKLKYIKCLATTNIGNGYTTNWVGSVKTTGTFVKDANITWTINTEYVNNTYGIPKDWTPQDYSPAP